MGYRAIRIMISGGGTGGHIFPAVSIADSLKELNPENEILFVGAEGKMEMEKVPAAGYRIIGLPMVGLQRQLNLKNIINDIQVPFKLASSLRKAGRLIREFRPDIVIGVGGYASAPLLWSAQRKGIPTLIQEQNGFAGLANRILGRKAGCICVAYDGMERFFPADRIVKTGNPIRKEMAPASGELRLEACRHYGLDPQKKHIFVVGGSLGSLTLNNAMKAWISEGCTGAAEVEVIWQCGRYYKAGIDAFMEEAAAKGTGDGLLSHIRHYDFISRMDLAYAAADLVISRSGASTVSELCAIHKPAIFVPSPNVAEDHQTHNAMALVSKGAAEIVKDADAKSQLMAKALYLLKDSARLREMEKNIAALALPDAGRTIAEKAYGLISGEHGCTKVYFIGIGGIGMSAIARYYKFRGYSVSGYDRTESELTRKLVAEGIPVHYDDDPTRIPADVAGTLVVYTPAVPESLGELRHAREKGYRVIKRSRMLGEIAASHRCLAVSGTHGKTTTSTLLAHMLTHSGEGCSAFLGGISRNYGTNMLVSRGEMMVAEADEFDRSFLQLYPEIAVITAMDPDHLDIYGDVESYRQAFRDFAAQVSAHLVIKKGLPLGESGTSAKIWTYSLSDADADFHAENAGPDRFGHFVFDLVSPLGRIEGIRAGIPGRINAENSLAAAAVCQLHGMDPEKIKDGISSYEGVKRRLEMHLNTEKITYIDDYAHHPQELESAIGSIREMFPSRKITAVFQPHLYTRTRDFAEGFAQALSLVDKLILLDIYPAREEPIPGVGQELIFDKVSAPQKVMLHRNELMEYLGNEDIDVLVTFGAGDIDRFTGEITHMLEKRAGI